MHRYLIHAKDFFVPSERNNFRAKGLHTYTLIWFLVFGISFNLFQQLFAGEKLGYATDITINKLLELTNEARTHEGLPPLKYNDKLAEAARNKAQDMFTYNYWAHYRPTDGTPPWHFITTAGYEYEFAGENLAQGFLFSDAVLSGWMNSDTHRANILRPEYDDVGFAVLNGILNNQETTLVVQMFGKPDKKTLAENIVKTAKASDDNPININTNSSTNSIETSMPITHTNSFPTTSKASFTYSTPYLIAGLLLLILTVDFIFAIKLQVIRVGGKNLAHWLFLGSIVIALGIIKLGLVL